MIQEASLSIRADQLLTLHASLAESLRFPTVYQFLVDARSF